MGGGTLTSSWSKTVNAVVESPAKIIGIAAVWHMGGESGGGVHGTNQYDWRYIDANGNFVNEFDFRGHPTFQGMRNVVLGTDKDEMVRIPRFYVKFAKTGIPGTDSNGSMCWWLSDKSADGFVPHSAFCQSKKKDSNGKYVIANEIYWGRLAASYKGNTTANIYSHYEKNFTSDEKLFSIMHQIQEDPSTAVSNKNKKNNTDSYRLSTIYDLGAFRFLLLFINGSPDLCAYNRECRDIAKQLEYDGVVHLLYNTASTIKNTVCLHITPSSLLHRYEISMGYDSYLGSYPRAQFFIANPITNARTDIMSVDIYSYGVSDIQSIFIADMTIGETKHNAAELLLAKSLGAMNGGYRSLEGIFPHSGFVIQYYWGEFPHGDGFIGTCSTSDTYYVPSEYQAVYSDLYGFGIYGAVPILCKN